MAEAPGSFGELLRRYRTARGLSQTALAARSGVSVDAVGLLERGLRRAPRGSTVTRLAGALRLSPAQREALFEAAAGRPPLSARLHVPQSLHIPPTPLVGRDDEMDRARALLERPDVRLLTLTGPPGVGKTRLALELASLLAAQLSDGACVVALASLADAGLVPVAIRQALGLREEEARTPMEVVAAHCRARDLLLVLDNFEHLLEAGPGLGELLARAPGLRLLVTSRAALRVRGEHRLRVPPLGLPELDRSQPSEPAAIARAPAVELFLQRATASAASFRLTPDNAPAVAAICRHLDGLPLALELAAPWIEILTPEEMLERLESRLALLVNGAEDLPMRQRSMRATLESSYEMLGAGERALFRRLAAFAGSAPLGALEAVCQVPGGMLPALGGLVRQSLVQCRDGGSGETKVTMLETVREYAAELLRAAGEEEATLRAHAGHYVGLAAEDASRLSGAAQESWLDSVEGEWDNVRAALDWAADRGEVEAGLRLAGGLWLFWDIRGHRREGLSWLERLLAEGAGAAPGVRAGALLAAGRLAWQLGAPEHAADRYCESLALFRALDDRHNVAMATNGLGCVAALRGDYRQAGSLFEEACSLYLDLDNEARSAICRSNLAEVALQLGDLERSRALQEQSLAVKRRLGNTLGVAASLIGLGRLAILEADPGRAEELIEEARTLSQEMDAQRWVAAACMTLGDVARSRGDPAAARALYGQSLDRFRAAGDQIQVAACLERLAWVTREEGRPEAAARIYGAADRLRRAIGVPAEPVDRALDGPVRAAIRDELGGRAFAESHRAGGLLGLEDALAEASGAGPAGQPGRA